MLMPQKSWGSTQPLVLLFLETFFSHAVICKTWVKRGSGCTPLAFRQRLGTPPCAPGARRGPGSIAGLEAG